MRTSKRRCARFMKARGICGRKKHRRRPRTADSQHAHRPAPNLTQAAAQPTKPNQAWMCAWIDRRNVFWKCTMVVFSDFPRRGFGAFATHLTPIFRRSVSSSVVRHCAGMKSMKISLCGAS